MISVAFDCDGTLVDFYKQDTPRWEIVALFHAFQRRGCEMYIWSHQGISHAHQVMELCGLNGKCVDKGSFLPDIAVDDEERGLARVVIPA